MNILCRRRVMFVTDFKLNGKFSFRLNLQEHQTPIILRVFVIAAAAAKILIRVFIRCVKFNLFVNFFSNIFQFFFRSAKSKLWIDTRVDWSVLECIASLNIHFPNSNANEAKVNKANSFFAEQDSDTRFLRTFWFRHFSRDWLCILKTKTKVYVHEK